jgi:hypothetical protein
LSTVGERPEKVGQQSSLVVSRPFGVGRVTDHGDVAGVTQAVDETLNEVALAVASVSRKHHEQWPLATSLPPHLDAFVDPVLNQVGHMHPLLHLRQPCLGDNGTG